MVDCRMVAAVESLRYVEALKRLAETKKKARTKMENEQMVAAIESFKYSVEEAKKHLQAICFQECNEADRKNEKWCYACDLGQAGVDLSGMDYSSDRFLEGKKDEWENELQPNE